MPLFTTAENKISEKYSKKVTAPQYQITGKRPLLGELVNSQKTAKLINEIKKSGVSIEEKDFLIRAAQRHLQFNYANIAEYYAHADPELQKLMEDSALVIIDFEDAIMNGYAEFSKNIRELRNSENKK